MTHPITKREPTRRTSTSLGWRLARAIALVCGCAWALSLGLVVLFANIDRRGPSRAIVVLGAAQYDGRPSPVLRARVDHALDLWHRGFAPVLIMTGGRGANDTTTEAAVERRYAVAHGIPDSVILIEPESRSTSESLRNVASMFGGARPEVILVSDPFHMFRLAILARRFGLRPRTSPTHTSPISANRGAFWRYTLHESWKAPAAFFLEFYERP